MEMTEEIAAPASQLQRPTFVRWYIGAAILLLNTILLLVVVNLICWAVISIHHLSARPSYLSYSDDWYRKVYPSMKDDQWKELVRETKQRPTQFQPYTMFTEAAYHGQYINISDQGFRIIANQGPWPMDPKNYNVLTFGGSTMFGWGVTDDQTIPAYLQTILQNNTTRRICVYNFGRPAYFSTQERILFEQLLRDGAKPNLVVFMDGLNDFLFAQEPTFLQQSQDELLAPAGMGSRLMEIWRSLPAGQMTDLLARKLHPPAKQAPADWSTVDPGAIDRYVWNIKAVQAICASQGIACVFIFQPMPMYDYGKTEADHDWNGPGDQWTIHGYPLMAKYVQDHDMGNNFLWLADMQKGLEQNIYVDKWHYTPGFSQQIAAEVYKFLQKRDEAP
jgi:hypothetical protein